jgi:outer membrane protein OmpA-like peptidoglycan-associated protein
LFLVAHGSNHPLVSNATAAGRAKNRRIELVVYPEHSAAAD